MTKSSNDPTTQIEIGAVRPDELESLLALVCEVFGLPYEPAREIFYGDPYLNLENKRVLRVGGRIVSCLNIADRDVWINSQMVRVGGIAGVATHSEERGKGYASRLISDTLNYLKAQGYVLSALVPYSSHFYRRLGYEICGNACRYVTAPSFLPSSHEIRNVRPARPDDAELMETCYGRCSIHCQFYGSRDVKRWRYLLQNIEQCHVYSEENGEISGYVLSDLRQTSPAFDGDTSMPTLRVLELTAQTKEANRGLLAHLAAQNSAGMIEFSIPSNLIYEMNLDILTGTGIGEEILANIEIIPMLMARVINFRSLIELNLPNAEWHGGLRLEIRDSSPAGESQSWTVMRDPKGETIRLSLESDSIYPCLSGDMRVWAQVVTGFKGTYIAAAQGLLFASDETAVQLGASLFPHHPPFLPTPDHF